ncbi:MAG: DUF1841 family protein [Betaproteobacteria bacterium]|nr:MAG: DUF1841 family protein [Betaproteobacteria bacterium]
MFNPSRSQARELFFDTWEKYRSGQQLDGLESTALEVIMLHPEYHALLSDRERNIERDYPPESGAINPFLHLSLHLSIAEQLAIDQPPGIADLLKALVAKHDDRHAALHDVLECLGESVWQANRSGSPPDQNAYIQCLRDRLENKPT